VSTVSQDDSLFLEEGALSGPGLVATIFSRHWSAQTSHDPGWRPDRPSTGQCAISALALQELVGGEIARVTLDSGDSHYLNVVDGCVVDVTADQFDQPPSYAGHTAVSREALLSDSRTAGRYALFREGLWADLCRTLSAGEVSHVAIRDPRYVAGTADRPEIGVFCQTDARRAPLQEGLLRPGQVVYMKWAGGPVVARSRIVSWHLGEFRDGNINRLRELTVGSRLFGLTPYWETVSKKGSGHYAVVHLGDEEWLETLLYPSARSYGSSWVCLDTLKKNIQWLSLDHEPAAKEAEKGRSLPASVRFMVLRRDGFACRYCGRRGPDVELHVDHEVPWSKSQNNRLKNLRTACRDCNLGKGARDL
jgi:hypothetical protein